MRHLFLVFLPVVFLATSSGFAAQDSRTYLPFLHASAGISMPSQVLSLETQPAAIGAANGLRVSGQGEAEQVWDDADYRGALFYGLSWLGVGASMEKRPGDEYVARYGLSVDIQSIGLSLGAAGESGVKNVSGDDARAGLLFRPVSHFQFGATALGLRDGADEYGIGLAMELLPGAALVFDASSEPDLKETDVKAGLKLGSNAVGITASYGTSDSRQIVKGVSGGCYIRFGRLSTLELYYRPAPQFGKYYAALTIGF